MRIITFAIAVMAVLPASVILFTDSGAAAGAGTIGLMGDGTELSPYLVSSADDLRTVSASHSNHPWAYYRQTSDIVFDNGTVPGGNITINISKESGKVVIGIGTDVTVQNNEETRTTYAHVTLNDSQASSEWNDKFDDVSFSTSALQKKNTVVVSGRVNDINFATAVSFSEINEKISATAPFNGNFTPIGSKEYPFSGFYDGGGYSITGMKAVSSGVGESSAGMFGYTNNAMVFNTNIRDTVNNASYMISTAAADYKYTSGYFNTERYSQNSFVGSFIGHGTVLSSIALCSNSATVCSISDFDSERYTNSSNAEQMIEINSSVGGLAGFGVGEIRGSMNAGDVAAITYAIAEYGTKISFNGSINIDLSIVSYAGGLIGQSSGAVISTSGNSGGVRTMIHTYSHTVIKTGLGGLSANFGTTTYIGGIAGSLMNGRISDVYNDGDIQYSSNFNGRHVTYNSSNNQPTLSNTTSLGGIAGLLSGSSKIDRAHSVGNISGKGGRIVVTVSWLWGSGTEKTYTSSDKCDIGEIIGTVSGTSASVDGSYYLKRSQNYPVVGKGKLCSALMLNAPSMTNINTFIGWDFGKVWKMSDKGYPVIWVRYDLTITDDSKVYDGKPKYSVDREHYFDSSGTLRTYTDKDGFVLRPIGDYDRSDVTVYMEMPLGGRLVLEKDGNDNYKIPMLSLRDASAGITLRIEGLKLNHFSVTDVINVPEHTTAGVPLTLIGTVIPNNATNKNITWTVKNPGTTGAYIEGNTLRTTNSGVVTITAAITDGEKVGTPYTKNFTITVQPVPVTDITDVPSYATAGIPLTLTGSVIPGNATNKNIAWSVSDPGTTGGYIDGNVLITANSGIVTMTAAITDGEKVGKEYTKEFTITVQPIPVIDVIGVPADATAGTPLLLAGTISPGNATNKSITWSVLDPGTTGAMMIDGILGTTNSGIVTIKATIIDGCAIGTPFTKEFTITVQPVPVTDVIDVPDTWVAGIPLTMTGSAIPGNATNKNIIWSVLDPGTTGAHTDGNVLKTTNSGVVTMTATITDGEKVGTPYTKNFTITVQPVPVTDIMDVPGHATAGTPLILTGTIVPDNATNKNIIWSVLDPGTTGAHTDGNVLKTTNSGIVTMTATITDGEEVGTPYTKNFTITVQPVPVTDIIDVPDIWVAGTPLILTGSVISNNATNTDIMWSISDPGTTRATMIGGVLETFDVGTVKITATIIDGCAIETPYMKEFTITVQPVPAIGVIDVPDSATTKMPLILSGTVVPDNATKQNIKWVIKDQGTTGATIDPSTNTLRTTCAGTVIITAVILDGTVLGTPYMQDIEITVRSVPVTGIANIPETIKAGEQIILNGSVIPNDATYQLIEWHVLDPRTAGAVISDNMLETFGAGIIVITATIFGATENDIEYSENFTITVQPVPATDIIEGPRNATAGVPLTLSAKVVPNNSTNKNIIWTVSDPGTTGATIDGGTCVLNTTAAGRAIVTATIIDGTEVGEDLFESFIIDVLPAPVPLVPADMTMMIAIGAIVAAMIAVTIFVMMHARSVLTKCDAKENKTKNKAKRQYKAGPEGNKNEHAGPILQDGSLHNRH